jgi:hypothetical protein
MYSLVIFSFLSRSVFASFFQGERYRYLRVKATGPNQRGDNALPICAFEFYGSLFRS